MTLTSLPLVSIIAQTSLGKLTPKATPGYQYLNPADSLSKVVSNLIGFITIIAGIGFVFYFIIGAVNWITAGGETNKAQAARTMIINALIGLTLTVIAYPVLLVISKLLGIPLQNPQELFDPPQPAQAYGPDVTGFIKLANNLLKTAIYGSLLFALVNFLVSAIQYLGSSGNPEIIKQASSRIWMSLLGLVVAGSSLIIAGLLGLILFGDPSYIINPTIYGPGP